VLAGFNESSMGNDEFAVKEVSAPSIVILAGWIGRRTLYAFAYLVDLFLFCGNALSFGRKHRNIWNRATYSSIIAQIIFSGVDALPIVTVLGMAIGVGITTHLIHLIFTLGNINDVARMMSEVIVMELGPIVTAIILIGRSGSAVTVDLGTMKVNRQIEGLEVLGVDVDDVFVVPRLVAIAVSQLILALWFTSIILLSGVLSSTFFYGTSATLFLQELFATFTLGDTFNFVVKNLVFGLLIGGGACFHGLKVGSASTEVAQQTQRSIVNSLALVFVLDGLLMAAFR
jgi:phospholipid/cholesterol/gamma-HCH transport system permease protein